MAVSIANEIANYLQSVGEGTSGENIFVDLQPDTPADCVTIFDVGGSSQEPPENWRELYIQARCQNNLSGYERIWRILNLILYPANGLINGKYTAELQDIPAIMDRDNSGRAILGFRVTVRDVSDTKPVDPWLEALASWTAQKLGVDWTIYRGWPGNKRPSITWQITNIKVNTLSNGLFKVQKNFSGRVLSNSPNMLTSGTTLVIEELGKAIKIPFDILNKKYLTVINPQASFQPDLLTAGQITLTLSKITTIPSEEMPLITAVHNKGEVM